MSTFMTTLSVLGALGLGPQMTSFAQEMKCLTEAVLAESALVKTEDEEADAVVALSIYNRSLDGRWGKTEGKTVCETVNTRWKKTEYRTVRQRIRAAKGLRAKLRVIRKAFISYRYDYSYHGKKYAVGLVNRVTKAQHAKARQAAYVVLTGTFVPKNPDVAETLHYMYREYSSTNGAKWFDCTAKPLGRAIPESVHMHYRDQTEKELVETLEKMPDCQKYITAFRFSRDQNNLRKLQASAQ